MSEKMVVIAGIVGANRGAQDGGLDQSESILAAVMAEEERTERLEKERRENPYRNADNYSNPLVKKYVRVSYWCEELVENEVFKASILFVIVIAGLVVGLQTYPSLETSATLGNVDLVILFIFTVEVVLKIIAEGVAPWRFFNGEEWKWNLFDFSIVILSMPFWNLGSGGSVKLLRLFRLMRVVKLLKRIPQLQMIVMGLLGGLRSIVYILALMGLVFYLYAIIGFYLFSKNDPYHFGSVPVSIVTLFRMSTLEDWSDILYTQYFGCDSDLWDSSATSNDSFGGCDSTGVVALQGLTVLYCISFVVIAALVMLSLFIGAVTMSMTESMQTMKMEAELAERRRRMKKAKLRAEKEKERIQVEENSQRNVSTSPKEKGKGGGEEEEEQRVAVGSEEKSRPSTFLARETSDQAKAKAVITNLFPSQKVWPSRDGDRSTAVAAATTENKNRPTQSRFSRMAKTVVGTIRGERGTVWNPFTAAEKKRADDLDRVRSAFKGAWEGVDLSVLLDDRSQIQYHGAFKRRYGKLAYHCSVLSFSKRFNNFIVAAIFFASLLVGLQTEEYDTQSTLYTLINVSDWVVIFVFLFEVVVKTIAEAFTPWRYFASYGHIHWWNVFDYIVAIGSLFPGEASMLMVLRLLRLLRVLKLIKTMPELQVIVVALIGGITSISYIGVILFLVFYVFAIIGMILFQEADPWHFGSLHFSLVTLFRMATLDDWTDVMYINMLGCDKYGYTGIENLCVQPAAMGLGAVLFFTIFVLLGALVLMTLFVGVVTTSMEQATKQQEEANEFNARLIELRKEYHIEEKTFLAYKRLFNLLDLDGSGSIEEEELRIGLESIGKCPSPEELSNMLKAVDEDGSGEIDLLEFCVLMSVVVKYQGGDILAHSSFQVRKSTLVKPHKAEEIREHLTTLRPTLSEVCEEELTMLDER